MKKGTNINPLAIGAGAAIVLGIVLYERNKAAGPTLPPASDGSSDAPPVQVKPKSKSGWKPAAIPLQLGMYGDLVKTLQTALNKKLASPIAVDGRFGDETLTALKSLNLPTTVTADNLKKIQGTPANDAGLTPVQKLVRAGFTEAEATAAITLRQKLTGGQPNVDDIKKVLAGDYNTTADIKRAYESLFKTNLINDLKNIAGWKAKLNDTIVKLQALSGLGPNPGTVFTKKPTYVRGTPNNLIFTEAKTRLGKPVGNDGDNILFENDRGKTLSVPASDVDIVWHRSL